MIEKFVADDSHFVNTLGGCCAKVRALPDLASHFRLLHHRKVQESLALPYSAWHTKFMAIRSPIYRCDVATQHAYLGTIAEANSNQREAHKAVMRPVAQPVEFDTGSRLFRGVALGCLRTSCGINRIMVFIDT